MRERTRTLTGKTRGKKPLWPRISKGRLEEMIEEATVDCYNESEQVTGWFTMIEENLAVPFETTVLGVQVTVEGVDLNRSEQIVAIFSRGRSRQSLPILDLPLPTPPPAGSEWIEAYRRWIGEG
jgi:calcium binding protein